MPIGENAGVEGWIGRTGQGGGGSEEEALSKKGGFCFGQRWRLGQREDAGGWTRLALTGVRPLN